MVRNCPWWRHKKVKVLVLLPLPSCSSQHILSLKLAPTMMQQVLACFNSDFDGAS